MGTLSKLSMVVTATEGEELTYNRSSLLHGVIMEQISEAYAEEMHRDGLKPFSQSIQKVDNKMVWQVNCLTKTAYENIISPLMSDKFKTFELKHNGTTFAITEKTETTATTQDLIDQYYLGECDRNVTVLFQTPTAFRQQGQYVFYPDLSLIYRSLMNRFDSFEENSSVQSEETLEQLVEYSQITGYHLRSHSFSLEGVRIPSFTGRINLRIHGPAQLVNLIHMLLHYGEYSGVGIKTAIGMGKLQITGRRPQRDGK